MAVNVTRKEFVRPREIGGVAKLWEWCVNRQAGIFPYLLRKSSEGGGGDIRLDNPRFAGLWAGDEVYLIGDYDQGNLYEIANASYHNISRELAGEYNEFVQLESCQLSIDT